MWMLARKNGKTPFATAFCWAMGLWYSRSFSKIKTVAGSMKQNMEGFGFLSYNLHRLGLTVIEDAAHGLRVLDSSLGHSFSGSIWEGQISFEALAYKPDIFDAFNANIVLLDELELYKNAIPYGRLKDATKAYSNKLILAVTTAGDDGTGFCAQRMAYCSKIVRGEITGADADRIFAFLARADPDPETQEVNYLDPLNWQKANPNWGVTIRPEDMEASALQAMNDPQMRKEVLTRSIILNLMSGYGKKRGGTYQLPGNTGYPNQCIFVFDPEFETYCDEMAQKLVANKMDKNIIGYFSDNELPFGPKNLEGYLTLQNPGDPGRVYAESWLKKQGITSQQITDEHREEFAGVVAERYYKVVSEAIRKYDPNHLYLGSRLHGKPKFIRQIVEAAGRYCDVVAINYYGAWTPSEKTMKHWGEWAQKPFIITEFYTKGMDSGLANTTGAGFTVQTQQERGYAYQHFVLGLLESGNCVGWHWFRYQDNDPTAKGADPSNLDSNKGLIDNEYNLYKPLADAMKELNINAYRLADWFDQQSNNNQ